MLNDELICAYLDDELSPEQRAEVEQRLRADSGARLRLEKMRAADAALRGAFPAASQARQDQLSAAILAPPKPNFSHMAARWAPMAAALVFGVLLGRFALEQGNTETSFAITAEQARLLDTRVSGERIETRHGVAEIVLTVQSEAGDVCRQFRLSQPQDDADILACREGEADWRMVAAHRVPRAEGYTPAGAASPIDAAIDALGPVQSLDEAEERARISAHWR